MQTQTIQTNVSIPVITGISERTYITSKLVEENKSLKEEIRSLKETDEEHFQMYSSLKKQLESTETRTAGFRLCLIFEDRSEINKDCGNNYRSVSSTISYYKHDPLMTYHGPKLKQYIIVLNGILWNNHFYE